MSTSAPIVDCLCGTTAGRRSCPLHGANIGIRDVTMVYFGCPGGAHEWLPWCRMDDGSFKTRCIHCEREASLPAGGSQSK